MKQLVQNLKSGKMQILEVPTPTVSANNVLVKVKASLISAGTEGSKVSTARKGYIGKAKEKPEQVKQVLDTIKKEGFLNAYLKVMNKLDSWTPLGYSCAGEIIAVGDEVRGYKVGDKVACGGQDIANHAELVSVPVNLVARVPDNVEYNFACYTTLGAIALQGVRQADLRLGESCVIIGLGLVGQLTVQILKASGVFVIGIDISKEMVDLASQSGADMALLRNDESIEHSILNKTSNFGADSVIITASSNSTDLVDFAGKVLRKKGKVIIVGAVPTGFSRENYFKKELDLRMSCSYGPGRYDSLYEEKGIDYPIGYVRWTENRNMQAFLKLISENKINPGILTTHAFGLQKAYLAYEIILNKSEPYVGIVLNYADKVSSAPVKRKLVKAEAKIKIGFIGAGSFAQTYLLPNIKKHKNASLIGIANASGHSSKTVADKYGFNYASSDAQEIINDPDINTIFIATRHNLHFEQVLNSLKAGKNVFVEKPLTLTESQLYVIKKLFESEKTKSQHLMVGFNRRFAPFIVEIIKKVKGEKVALNYRINAGFVKPDHWTQDPEIGGGRIIGEMCHFVDLASYIAGSKPLKVDASVLNDASGLWDTLSVLLSFESGSVASISYYANGSKKLEKEYLEVFCNGTTSIIKDFSTLEVYGSSKMVKKITQDKGHANEVQKFLEAIEQGKNTPVPFDELFISSILPFKIIESIKSGNTVTLE